MVKKEEIRAFEKMMKKVKVDKKELKKVRARPTERSIDHFGLKRVDNGYETDIIYVVKKDKKGNIKTEFRKE